MSSIEKLQNINLRLKQLIHENQSKPLVAEDGWSTLVKYFGDLKQSQIISEKQLQKSTQKISQLEDELTSLDQTCRLNQKLLDSKTAELLELYEIAKESVKHSDDFAKLLQSTANEMKALAPSKFNELANKISDAKKNNMNL